MAATLAIVVPLAWLWWSSLLPGRYSVMDMGYADYGGGQRVPMHDGAGTSVDDLVETQEGDPDVSVELVAREEQVELSPGLDHDGYTVNHSSPGPTVRARVGDLVEVRFVNESVPAGATLHWHGVDVPNAADGVAGVTQDAVRPGEEFVYRFVAGQVGTYWYHSHQVSHEQVRRGLLGALVVLPRGGLPQDQDLTLVAHTYAGTRTLNGRPGATAVPAEPGSTVRVRVVNTDNAAVPVWADVPYRVVAIDGYDVNEPTPVEGAALTLTAGGRADLEVTVPGEGAAQVQVGSTGVALGPEGSTSPDAPAQPRERVDLLDYGSPADLGFDPEHPDRRFDYEIGRRPGFLDGKPGLWWTINGHRYPDIPMYVVEEGDVAVFRIANDSGESHPMHLHGHHAVVLSRNGEPSTGSPWWVDSLEVAEDEEYEIAFVADNPGVWMDHCHNLPHATEGLVAHLMYADVSTPYDVGGESDNQPE